MQEEIHEVLPEPFEIPELAFFYNYMERPQGRVVMKDVSRNNPCVCGSGKKLKKCCGEFDRQLYGRVIHAINHASRYETPEPRHPDVRKGLAAMNRLLLASSLMSSAAAHLPVSRPPSRPS